MAKAQSLAAKLARLRELSGQPDSPQLIKELAAALRDSSNFVVADAPELIGKGRFSELAPNLVEAFTRFLDKPLKKDKQCRAKIALVEALNQLEFTDENLYLRGVHYVQAEPVWEGTRDTAVPIRVACASSLVRLRHPDAMPLGFGRGTSSGTDLRQLILFRGFPFPACPRCRETLTHPSEVWP
jgi:hypothetical protein